MLRLSNIHYWVLSFSHLHIAQIHTEQVDFSAHVSLTFYGKGGRWEVFFERLSFNVERRGMENKYSGMLAWEETILYLCALERNEPYGTIL